MTKPTNEDIAFDDMVQEKYGRYFCRRCADKRIARDACERFSMRVYAGMYCDECWENDGRNHDREFDPDYAGEEY